MLDFIALFLQEGENWTEWLPKKLFKTNVNQNLSSFLCFNGDNKV